MKTILLSYFPFSNHISPKMKDNLNANVVVSVLAVFGVRNRERKSAHTLLLCICACIQVERIANSSRNQQEIYKTSEISHYAAAVHNHRYHHTSFWHRCTQQHKIKFDMHILQTHNSYIPNGFKMRYIFSIMILTGDKWKTNNNEKKIHPTTTTIRITFENEEGTSQKQTTTKNCMQICRNENL